MGSAFRTFSGQKKKKLNLKKERMSWYDMLYSLIMSPTSGVLKSICSTEDIQSTFIHYVSSTVATCNYCPFHSLYGNVPFLQCELVKKLSKHQITKSEN